MHSHRLSPSERRCGIKVGGANLCNFSKAQFRVESRKKTAAERSTVQDEGSRMLRWGGAACAVVVPWFQSLCSSSIAADIEAVAESEPIDMGAIVMGDLVLLGLAPLFIFAALKMMSWEPKESDNSSSTAGPLDPMLSANVRSVVKSTKHRESSYVWSFSDPEVREIAETAADNIETAVREAQASCDFQSSLHSLAVSHGGADSSMAWMDKVLQNTIEEVKSDSFMSEKLSEEALDNKEEACKTMARLVAQKSALHELKEMIHKIKTRSGRR